MRSLTHALSLSTQKKTGAVKPNKKEFKKGKGGEWGRECGERGKGGCQPPPFFWEGGSFFNPSSLFLLFIGDGIHHVLEQLGDLTIVVVQRCGSSRRRSVDAAAAADRCPGPCHALRGAGPRGGVGGGHGRGGDARALGHAGARRVAARQRRGAARSAAHGRRRRRRRRAAVEAAAAPAAPSSSSSTRRGGVQRLREEAHRGRHGVVVLEQLPADVHVVAGVAVRALLLQVPSAHHALARPALQQALQPLRHRDPRAPARHGRSAAGGDHDRERARRRLHAVAARVLGAAGGTAHLLVRALRVDALALHAVAAAPRRVEQAELRVGAVDGRDAAGGGVGQVVRDGDALPGLRVVDGEEGHEVLLLRHHVRPLLRGGELAARGHDRLREVQLVAGAACLAGALEVQHAEEGLLLLGVVAEARRVARVLRGRHQVARLVLGVVHEQHATGSRLAHDVRARALAVDDAHAGAAAALLPDDLRLVCLPLVVAVAVVVPTVPGVRRHFYLLLCVCVCVLCQ
eukprot:Rhum_TRINITY_DN15065_c10_g1::Rhum_TRINITY_DN15065_c10_g1_i1::g.137370::m.137370